MRRIDADHLRAQPDVPLQPVAAQVEPAVAEAQRLVDVLLVELERERRAARDDLERVDLELDLAGRQLRVDGLGRAGDDLALGAEHELVAHLVRDACASGARSGLITSWQMPARSRRSMKTSPPWSRRVSTQPASVEPLADVLGPHVAAQEVAPAHARHRRELSVGSSGLDDDDALRAEAARPAVCWPFTERPA